MISEVKAASSNNNVDGFVADFSNMEAVKSMAKCAHNLLPKIDVLINNAGVFKSTIHKTEEGLDIRFAVNYFAPYLLTKMLMPLLEKGRDTRLVNLSSAAQSTVTPGVLNGQVSISASEAYAQSKLALTMWSFDMAKKYETIQFIAVNPGSLLNTRMVAEAYGQHWAPADKGANILYELAVSQKYKGITGMYFDNDKGDFGKAHPDAYNDELVVKLIEQTSSILFNKV